MFIQVEPLRGHQTQLEEDMSFDAGPPHPSPDLLHVCPLQGFLGKTFRNDARVRTQKWQKVKITTYNNLKPRTHLTPWMCLLWKAEKNPSNCEWNDHTFRKAIWPNHYEAWFISIDKMSQGSCRQWDYLRVPDCCERLNGCIINILYHSLKRPLLVIWHGIDFLHVFVYSFAFMYLFYKIFLHIH